MCCCLTITTNSLPYLNTLVVNLHRNLLPMTMDSMKFWMAFISKFLAYSVNLIINYNLFFNASDNFFSIMTHKFDDKKFNCKEDQAAYNIIIFVSYF